MRLTTSILLSALFAEIAFGSTTGDVIRTLAELKQDVAQTHTNLIGFLVTGTAVCASPPASTVVFLNAEECFLCLDRAKDVNGTAVRAGDLVRATGTAFLDRRGIRKPTISRIEIIGRGPAPRPVDISAREALSGRYDWRPVRLQGQVVDEFTDEIDRENHFLLLASDDECLTVALNEGESKDVRRLLGAEVRIVGICNPLLGYVRLFHGHGISSSTADITVMKAAPEDPFDVPPLEIRNGDDPRRIFRLSRRSAEGRVLAVWHGDHFLLRTDDRRLVTSVTSGGTPLPECGRRIRIVGLPDTDLFNIHFANVIWKNLPENGDGHEDPEPHADPWRLTYGYGPKQPIHHTCHGSVFSFEAVVRSVPRSDFNNARMYVEFNDHILPINVSACPTAVSDVEIGCRVSITGVCILETESRRLNVPVPKVKGFTIVLRHPQDLRILSRPSWWTAGRLLAVIGILLAVILAVLLWNVTLRRLAERRGKELAASVLAKAESDLKVFERTRLAVELHDSVAQNLTGASLALRGKNYELAARTLDSCREDLRNCLWDLRNLTLDDGDINAAIRKTLAPHVGEAALAIRFNVPRERFTDNTTHAILRILRELATNAVRHGGATAIRIAGSIEGDRLLFSVRDDGCGFDPASAPGMEQGHFGLQGIRDRIDALEGDVTIDSARGKGTKVTVSLHVPQERKEDRT